MKLKILVMLGAWILGSDNSEEAPRADMYLPIWLLAFALVLIIAGAAALLYSVVCFSVGAIVGGVFLLGLGVSALLCWRNQTIKILPNDSFEYTTFLGNQKIYRFSQITGLKRNSDSVTLLVGDGKVHIESCAVLSEELVQKLDHALNEVCSDRSQ